MLQGRRTTKKDPISCMDKKVFTTLKVKSWNVKEITRENQIEGSTCQILTVDRLYFLFDISCKNVSVKGYRGSKLRHLLEGKPDRGQYFAADTLRIIFLSEISCGKSPVKSYKARDKVFFYLILLAENLLAKDIRPQSLRFFFGLARARLRMEGHHILRRVVNSVLHLLDKFRHFEASYLLTET